MTTSHRDDSEWEAVYCVTVVR